MMKVRVDYPTAAEESVVVQRSLGDAANVTPILTAESLAALQKLTQEVYVDGSIVDYRSEADVLARADERAWLDRLIAAGIDELVILRPATCIESRWVAAHPDLFVKREFAATDLDPNDPAENASYRFVRDRALQTLPPPR